MAMRRGGTGACYGETTQSPVSGVREKGLPPGTAAATSTFSPGACVVPHTSPVAGNGKRVQRGEFADVHGHRTGRGNVSYRLPRGSHLTWHGSVPRPILAASAEGIEDVQGQTTDGIPPREREVVFCDMLSISPASAIEGSASPLTKRAQRFAFGSAGLAILSHKGRGIRAASAGPQARPAIEAPYLSPCGRG